MPASANTVPSLSTVSPVGALPDGPQYSPDIAILQQHADELRQAAQSLQVPQRQGISLGQALVGVLGAAATSNNPHAQFVSQYMGSLMPELQQQYQNDADQYNAMRQNLLNQADVMNQRASGMINSANETYKTNVGYQGKINTAQIQATAKTAVAQMVQNSQFGKQLTTTLLNGSPADRATALNAMRQANPSLQYLSDQDIVNEAAQNTPKAGLQGAQADLASTKANDIDATQDARISQIKARASDLMANAKVNQQDAAWLAERTSMLPQQVATQAAKAKAYADSVAQQAANGDQSHVQSTLDQLNKAADT
jgi:hypothetical protein